MLENIDPPSHLRVVLSGMAGSSSLACWIVLLLPQLIEQWRLKSADGISIGFLIIWLLGDVTNLAGSLWANLRPEVILLAVWYCIADSLIMVSYFYYKRLARLRQARKAHKHKQHRPSSGDDHEEDPTAPLLDRRNSANRKRPSTSAINEDDEVNTNGPSHHEHHEHRHHHHHNQTRRDSLTSIVLETSSSSGIFSKVVLPVLFVIASGILGYLVSGNQSDNTGEISDEPLALGPQILGYTSAVLYLSARIPQIIQNHQRRSTHGLSLVFFVFSVLGNATYAAGILLYRTDIQWVTLYFPWLLGSLGTILEDCVIFLQFYMYDSEHKDEDSESAVHD
ncbi:Rtc2p [Sugiyamaella lignohabitans]|uniref:Rtc2p n=1 Tax=Sugiyamaella lignohabitans TaxID=796027 RepID=A0A167EUQ8_9ASCO|nr:Rtc2p [Sugiyamaella lignohabitans]ANB14482.1 Rtc2p [Sugiyamaella lignohabitans]